jgi:hypothetical protein
LFEVDGASDKRLKRRIVLGFFGGVQPPVGEIANAGRKTEAQQVTEAKHVVGEAGRVGVVFFDSQVRFMVKQTPSIKRIYMDENPVRAGVMKRIRDWPYHGELIKTERWWF